MIGSALGPYKIIEQLGAGGMGEVYLGEDTRLGRKVAIKVLPAEFASDPERLARFEQEARAAAALNHPHIAVVHDIGTEGDTHFMVQEYLEGQSLRERLDKGALPLEKALSLSIEVSEALVAAHTAGIIHRDLKPDNIFVTAEGHAKVLDFGLAKLTEVGATGAGGLSMSPTMLGTAAGQVMGTAGYMAPEQAQGSGNIDHRADVFAFGCVLYEVATGKQPFGGRSIAESLSLIQHEEPTSIIDINPSLPVELRRIINRCLAKRPGERYQVATDLAIDLRALRGEVEAGTALHGAVGPGVGTPPGPGSGVRVPAAGAIVATFVLLAAGFWIGQWNTQTPDPGPVEVPFEISTEISLPPASPLPLGGQASAVGFDSTSIALSPDGSALAFVGMAEGTSRLYRRTLGSLAVEEVPGTEGAIHPFFSPDGESIGFLTNEQVKVSIRGGPPQALCDAETPVAGVWLRGDVVYFTASQLGELWRVDAAGGECREVGPAVRNRRYGHVLPSGEWVLVADRGLRVSSNYSEIQLVSLETLEIKPLIPNGYDARYVATGHILFGRAGGLYAVQFDVDTHSVTGEPMLLASDVRMDSFFSVVQVTASDSGMIAYVPGGDASIGKIAWVDRDGTTELLPLDERLYGSLDLSPDGNRIAVHVADVTDYIGVYTIDRGEWRRLRAPENDGWPVFSPDGEKIAFISRQPNGVNQVLVQDIDDADSVRGLFRSDRIGQYVAWHPTDDVMGVGLSGGNTKPSGITFLPISSDGPAAPQGEPMFQAGGMHSFSPDGTFVVYNSAESGQVQTHVRSYPGNVWVATVSDRRGTEARWCARCDAIFYRSANQFFAVPVRLQPAFAYDPPVRAFEVDGFIDTSGFSFDITADGRRLLVVKRALEMPLTRVRLIQNGLVRR